MTTGKFTLVIRWPSGQSTICGEMTDHQHGEICRILSPDYHAQPSHGGEVVEEYQQLSRYGNWDRIDKAAFDIGILGACPEKFRALYTHPADQVAEGVVVSRELLDSFLKKIACHPGMLFTPIDGLLRDYDELRALLASKDGVKK